MASPVPDLDTSLPQTLSNICGCSLSIFSWHQLTICDFYQQIISSNHRLRREKSFSWTYQTFRSSFMAQSMLAGDPSLRMGRCIHRRWNTLCPQTVMDETQTDSWPVHDLNAATPLCFQTGILSWFRRFRELAGNTSDFEINLEIWCLWSFYAFQPSNLGIFLQIVLSRSIFPSVSSTLHFF